MIIVNKTIARVTDTIILCSNLSAIHVEVASNRPSVSSYLTENDNIETFEQVSTT